MPLFAPATALAGAAIGGSLIVAIGAQNAFVLRQGLRNEYPLAVAAICTACDWALISLGAGGFGALVSANASLTAAAAWLGAAFLIAYGALSFRSAIRGETLHAEESAPTDRTLLGVAAATLAVSLLNPHVYLDTVVLIGGIAGQYPAPERASFALGAGLTSLAWFFGLAYAARLLAPVFERPLTWRVLEALIGVVMWSIAGSLVLGQVG